jgi:hypothetical protein
MFMKRFLLVATISVVSITTVLSFSVDKAQKIKKNMSQGDVINIMGNPDSKKPGGELDGKPMVTWYYGNNFEINFVSDRVESVLSTLDNSN